MSANDSVLIAKFIDVTGANDSEARFYLESHGWDLDSATSTYFSTQGQAISPPLSPVQQQTPPIAQPIVSTTSNPAPTSRRTGGVRGFSDLGQDTPKDDGTVNWFTGGEKSGIQVQAPTSSKDIIDKVMKSAQEQGAQQAHDFEASQPQTFTGTGYRLGHTPTAPSQPIPSAVKKEVRKVITLWQNGFSVDDGPLRNFNDPANQAFFESITRGQVPAELQQQASGGQLLVDLVDKRGEEYKAPPKVIKPFSGSGQRLGSTSTTPAPVTTTTASTPVQAVSVDNSQPTTSIQIRLADGGRLVATFNHTHTISHIRSYINANKPTNGNYVLCSAFPQKEFADESQNIKDAGLLNSVVIQKMK